MRCVVHACILARAFAEGKGWGDSVGILNGILGILPTMEEFQAADKSGVAQRSASGHIEITLLVEGESMPLRFFVLTSRDLQDLLRRIEKAHIGRDPHTQWEVDADSIRIFASVNGTSADELESIVDDAHRTLWAVEAQDESAIPETVDDKGKEITQRIVGRAKKTAPVTIEAPGMEPVHIEVEAKDRSTARPARRRRKMLSSWGSVDGQLDVISVRTRPHFVIYEHLRKNQVRCAFPDEWMDKVKDLLGHRVIVKGRLRYRANGTVAAISDPITIDMADEPKRSLTEFRGLLPGISGELSSSDFIKQLRQG